MTWQPGAYGFFCAVLVAGLIRLLDILAGPPSYMPTWVYVVAVLGGSFGMIHVGRILFRR